MNNSIATTNPKASFDDLYKKYSPVPYCSCLLSELDYRLPFNAMNLLKKHISSCEQMETLNTLIIGSGHGLDSAALKYNCTFEEILETPFCSEESCTCMPLDGNPQFNITMTDINESPLRFARNFGLCNNFFVYDMSGNLTEEMLYFLKNEVDLAICTGVTSYLDRSAFSRLTEALLVEGKAKYLCFSLLGYLNDRIDIIENFGLQVCKLGDVKQRNYRDQDEKIGILKLLRSQKQDIPGSEECLMTSVYIAQQAG
ncbi:MAG: hypothetical protein D3907_01940 [Candidatus Electrothrix sp. AUS3]|nr:hypothetical protein [Candidatus Electrothrix gigas]